MERFRLTALAGIAVISSLITAGCATAAREAASVHVQVTDSPSAAATPTPFAPHTPLPVSGPCTTAELSVAASGHRTLAGLQVERFLATDASDLACSLTGSPQLTPYGPLSSAQGVTSDIAVSQEEFDGDDEGTSSAGHIDLQPGQAAAFDVAWYAASPVVCEQATGFGFSAPGDSNWSGMRRVGYPFGRVCDGLFYVSTVRSPAQ